MSKSPSTLGARLVQARQKAGLGQDAVAKAVGMSQQSYSDLETGQSKRTTRVGSLAHTLGVNALWLETGNGPMFPGRVAEDAELYLPLEKRRLLDLFDRLGSDAKKGLMALLEDIAHKA